MRRIGFWGKAAGVAGIAWAVEAAGVLCHGGSWWGVLAGALAALVIVTRAPSWRTLTGRVALTVAALLAIGLFDDPGPLGWGLFWAALSVATLSPRTVEFDDALRWSARLLRHALSGPLTAPLDLRRLIKVAGRRPQSGAHAWIRLLWLPLIGTSVFVALFALANPLIADAIARVRLPSFSDLWQWSIIAALIWPLVRPNLWAARVGGFEPPRMRLAEATLPSLLLALGLFNAVFAVQNTLDLVFLWSGAPLPDGMTLADYAHRGAYPLIATALLAGGFVLVMLRPGTATAASLWARRLVIAWVAQNVFLVASSALRTIDYVNALGLTQWRLAALAWMGLVALGLVLIVWRLMAGRSGRWLINANALAAAVTLLVGSVVDLGAVSAAYNVAHAKQAGGDGAPLDLCYLGGSGDSGLLPLIALEARPLSPQMRSQVVRLRARAFASLAEDQADWRSWTWRGARRLAEARAGLGPLPAAPPSLGEGQWMTCDGSVRSPAPPPEAAQPSAHDGLTDPVR